MESVYKDGHPFVAVAFEAGKSFDEDRFSGGDGEVMILGTGGASVAKVEVALKGVDGEGTSFRT